MRPGAQGTLVTTGRNARAWMRFIVSPAPGAALPATSPAGLVVVMLALATPLAMLICALLQPEADWAGIGSSVEFRLTRTEALMVLVVAPAVEEAVFRWPLGSRRAFERALLRLPLALVAIAACSLLAGESGPLSIVVAAAALAGTALLGLLLNDLLERRRFTDIEPARTLFARRYALLAHGSTLAFALTAAAARAGAAAVDRRLRVPFRARARGTGCCCRAARRAQRHRLRAGCRRRVNCAAQAGAGDLRRRVAGAARAGQWYHALCADRAPHDGHWVLSHCHAHEGQTPPVQKV